MNKNYAQSILELIAMIMFVAATIFIAGPTIIRGINAHFKIWDDSVQDSYKDPLKQSPPINLPSDCICDPPIGGLGQRCNASPCGPTERLETTLCNPVGCGAALGIPESICLPDSACCDKYVDTALCGLGGPPPDCPITERITQRPCGEGATQTSCRVDIPGCTPRCIGTYYPNEAAAAADPTVPVICPGDDTGLAGPWVRYPGGVGVNTTLVGQGVGACASPPNPNPTNKCDTYCSNGYIPWGAGCAQIFSCSDGVKNGTETGIDCGGSCPPCTTCHCREVGIGGTAGCDTYYACVQSFDECTALQNPGPCSQFGSPCIATALQMSGTPADDPIPCPGPVCGTNVIRPTPNCCSGNARYSCNACGNQQINDVDGICL